MDRSHAVMGGLWLAVGGCAGPLAGPSGPGPVAEDFDVVRATEVVDGPEPSDGPFGDPARAVDGVRGGGQTQGSVDVFSLGLDGPALTLAFPEPVVDGDGVDLAVFENPFAVNGGGWFLDPVVVEVSADCAAFVALPHAYDGGPDYVADPEVWSGFAGLGPVSLHEEDNPVDPLGDEAGGDRFDLGALPAEDLELLGDGVVCVRLSAAAAWTDPATGTGYPVDPVSNGPDIDGVYGRR